MRRLAIAPTVSLQKRPFQKPNDIWSVLRQTQSAIGLTTRQLVFFCTYSNRLEYILEDHSRSQGEDVLRIRDYSSRAVTEAQAETW